MEKNIKEKTKNNKKECKGKYKNSGKYVENLKKIY